MLFSFLLSLRIAVILEKNQNQSFALHQILALFYRQDFARLLICALICRQNVLEMVHRVENPAMDSTKTYSHCWVFRDVPYMTHFHGKCHFIVRT